MVRIEQRLLERILQRPDGLPLLHHRIEPRQRRCGNPKFCRHQGHPIDLSDAELACDLALAAFVVGKQCVAGRHALRCRSVG
ncbi:MAG TPA: hypothetical protein VE687_09880, partial [Stellaceae bacterium]|nr:hypothetical protein [Stellaceae bacterium]